MLEPFVRPVLFLAEIHRQRREGIAAVRTGGGVLP